MTLLASRGSHGPAELTRLKRENENLRAALKPFAKAARCAEDDEDWTYGLDCSSARHELTIGDLFRAKAALAAK